MNKSHNISVQLGAMVIYAAFTFYLYQPHFERFGVHREQYLFLFSGVLGSLGCFILSRRWVASFTGSCLAGAIYGFGPFMLGLGRFHPAVSLLAAAIPWLFFPAVFINRKWRFLQIPLAAIPFLAIIAFFQICQQVRFFAIGAQVRLLPAEMAYSLSPLVMAQREIVLFGFYHVPIAALILGVCMMVAARRYGMMTVLAAGFVLSFCRPILGVSSISWLMIPALCCAVMIGEGFDAIVLAGEADSKWLLLTAVVLLLLSIAGWIFAGYCQNIFAGLGGDCARLFAHTAKMYLLTAVAVGTVFFMAKSKMRAHQVRMLLLCTAMVVDIFIGAQFIVDKVF